MRQTQHGQMLRAHDTPQRPSNKPSGAHVPQPLDVPLQLQSCESSCHQLEGPQSRTSGTCSRCRQPPGGCRSGLPRVRSRTLRGRPDRRSCSPARSLVHPPWLEARVARLPRATASGAATISAPRPRVSVRAASAAETTSAEWHAIGHARTLTIHTHKETSRRSGTKK